VREMCGSISRSTKAGGWGRVELVEAKGEKHVFHIPNPHNLNTTMLI